MCGFGEKDRRPIDPPPIVQLIVKDAHDNTPVDLQLKKEKKKRKPRYSLVFDLLNVDLYRHLSLFYMLLYGQQINKKNAILFRIHLNIHAF